MACAALEAEPREAQQGCSEHNDTEGYGGVGTCDRDEAPKEHLVGQQP